VNGRSEEISNCTNPPLLLTFHLLSPSLWLSVMRKNIFHSLCSDIDWISDNEKCIANYFSVWVLVFLVSSASPWLVTYKTECRSRKILPYIT